MIIGIFGKVSAGKTTLAGILTDKYGFVRLGFADALRDITRGYLGIDTSWKNSSPWRLSSDSKYIDGINRLFSNISGANEIKSLIINRVSKARNKYEAYRITLELIGTEVFRNFILNDIWNAVLIFKVFKHLSNNQNVVIDDIRFDNEYNTLSNLNPIFIKIKSPFEEPINNHESQKHIDNFKFDYLINNDGTKEDLFKKFKDLNII